MHFIGIGISRTIQLKNITSYTTQMTGAVVKQATKEK